MLVGLLMAGCSKRSDFINGEVVVIDSFAESGSLQGEKLDYVNSKGFFCCEVRHPYLLLQLSRQNNHVAVYDLQKRSFVGDCFAKGKAANEYMAFNFLNQYDDSVFWTIDPQRRVIHAYSYKNVSDSGCMFKEVGKQEYKIAEDVFVMFMHGGKPWLYKAYSKEKGLYYKKTVADGIVSPFPKKFSMNDINRVTALSDAMKPDGSKVVSLSGSLDEIDIISLDGSDGNLAVTPTGRNISWKDLKESSTEKRIWHFLAYPRCSDKYIVALHDNQTNRELLVIDWEGNGLAKYTLGEKILDVAVDWKNGDVYGVTEKDEVYRYKVPLLSNRLLGMH